jgi:hypothetical protein
VININYRQKQIYIRFAAAAVTLLLSIVYIKEPSFPTPDKLVIYGFCFFAIFGQGLFVLKRLLPFVIILLAYDSFIGVADQLNTHVNHTFAPAADRTLFGQLPTKSLQDWLWSGSVRWYDITLYIPYLFHFVMPLGLAILVWFKKPSYYWRYVTTFSIVSFAAFFTFLIFPASPPWMASQDGTIEPIVRISSDVWLTLGITDFPSLYNHISPNAVAAVPSLHTAWAVLVAIFAWKYFGKKWGMLSTSYPLIIIFGTIYEGEHYAIDAILGIVYALAAYALAPKILKFLNFFRKQIIKKLHPLHHL